MSSISASKETPLFENGKVGFVFIDPINDFLQPGGKLYPALSDSLKATSLIEKLQRLRDACHNKRIPIFYCPHHNLQGGDFKDWKHLTPSQILAEKVQFCQKGSNGAEWFTGLAPDLGKYNDRIIANHWSSDSFSNTDLDHQLRRMGIEYVFIAGLEALSCIEATGRHAVELGYHTTMISDGTAAFSQERYDAATKINSFAYAHSVITIEQVLNAIDKLTTAAKI